ncbi:hypothetical protein [Paramaledivibacter caminithermalis]|jgi:hypothetical protein|uniref:Peptidase_C39 like family protein n=1 Tax=Paramaledivibacter caminithermalis (strain DSM 15212 / CIP 107654 / DViRD3) TaxID=1121301 RepID=A0A1M6M190_PARC5|nr:hypothetical protein [Paramaledivibacter caminithermalis]SHJ77214.1 hypothetical protein SAMN02745912_01025 [Paramaledivibacter caminithermalis DSM 15212]
MKKILFLALVVVMTFSMTVTSYANDMNTVVTKGESGKPYFSEQEAADIALLFVLENMSEENIWNINTMINKVYTLYNLEGDITGYTFNLSTAGVYSGYITVSSNEYEMPIQEFSFHDKPIFETNVEARLLRNVKINDFSKNTKNKAIKENKIIHNGPLEYYINSEGKYYDMDKKVIKSVSNIKKQSKSKKNLTASKKNKELKELIKNSHKLKANMGGTYDGQKSGYVITDRFAYMKDRYGSYTYQGGKSLSGYDGLDMDNYGGDNDCSLVSITTMANWYQKQGFTKIPSSPSDIYDDVLAEALNNGYTPSGGTNPTKIDNIIEDTFSRWGYSVNASNIYVWSFGTFTNEIDANRPLMYNLATGYYSNHSISVFGYKKYDVADFLMVKDNWTTSTRYIHWQQMIDEIGSVTKMKMN